VRADYTSSGTLSTGKLLVRDMYFLVSILTPVFLWCVFLVFSNFDMDDPETPEDESWSESELQILMFVFIIATVADGGFIVWRYLLWSRLMRTGVEMRVKLERYKQDADGLDINVTYTFEGREIKEGRIISGLIPFRALEMSEGQEVSILVSSENPERYLLLERYLKPPS